MNYKETVFLPRTTLPMKAKPEAELPILAGWEARDLYAELRSKRADAQPFVLHDGPPYANGDIHIGHALNKVLKDIVVRGQSMLGRDAKFRPGWDCHGLPIEWKVEEEWRKAKRDKAAEPEAFRADCRAYAQKWVDVQREQFKRLGVLADWRNPYLTMSPESESAILYRFHQLVSRGLVYRANKPVMWSPVEQTALADAETVDREHVVPNVWVKFVITTGPLNDEGASLLVWTTTPWSLPGNVAVAFNPAISYGLYETPSGRYVVADSLVEQALPNEEFAVPANEIAGRVRLRDVPISDFMMPGGEQGRGCYHPLGEGYKTSRLIPADFVRDNSGTGFVHVGPSHSTEDWIAWRDYAGNDAVFPNPILDNGVYADDVPVFAGMPVTKGKKLGPVNQAIVDHLFDQGALYRREDRPLTLQHSWRSDAVLITRATPQVFIDLSEARGAAMTELQSVSFTPESSKTRMLSMLEHRPDWLVSRQRMWGTPLGIFVHRETGAICDDPRVLGSVHQSLADLGAEAWFDMSPETFFSAVQRDDGAEWDRVDDVLDVWFDSACVHTFSMDRRADIVIEGTDQSRGWFQSSLLEAVAQGEHAPYREVFTHGFALDGKGVKMSKSQGNVLDPLKVIAEHGADVLRVWVASTDVSEDVRVSPDVLKTHAETARKIRNTMRYVVGAIDGTVYNMRGLPLPELERYLLHRVQVTNDILAQMLRRHQFTHYMATINNFCTNELSSLFFDIRKDVLYCDPKYSDARRAYRWALAETFDHIVRWIAPVMPFAAEELWSAVHGTKVSVHVQLWRSGVEHHDWALAEKWASLIEYRGVMLAGIEKAREAGIIKASTEAKITISVARGSLPYRVIFASDCDPAELTITGDAHVMVRETDDGLGVQVVSVEKITTPRCDRCWRSVDVEPVGDDHLCARCEDAIAE